MVLASFRGGCEGALLGCGNACACLISAVARTTHLSFFVAGGAQAASGHCERCLCCMCFHPVIWYVSWSVLLCHASAHTAASCVSLNHRHISTNHKQQLNTAQHCCASTFHPVLHPLIPAHYYSSCIGCGVLSSFSCVACLCVSLWHFAKNRHAV